MSCTAEMGVGVMFLSLLLAVMEGGSGQTWHLTLPQRIVSIRDSCVTLPCRFEVPGDQEANILNCSNSATWRKGSHHSSTAAQGTMVGDVSKKNCTTTMSRLPSDDVYFLRLDCPNVKFSFRNGVNISTQTEPSPPRLIVSHMSEGGVARLQCQTPVSCSVLPPSLTWSLGDASSQEESHIQQSADGLMTMTSTLTFTAAADHHNRTVLCSVSYPLSSGGSSRPAAARRRLNVLYAPRFTVATIDPSRPVFEGEDVTLTCSSDANPPVGGFTWWRGRQVVAAGRTLQLQVNRSHAGAYLCEARSPRGSQRSTPVLLEVSGTPGSSECVVVVPYALCGVASVLFILTLVVHLYQYHSLSRKLKKLELKREHTYTELKSVHVSSVYDQLQLKPKAPPEDPEYENGPSTSVTAKSPNGP